MELIQNLITVLGFMACSYTFAHLITPIVKKHDDNPHPPFYIRLLLPLATIFWIGSGFVFLLDCFLWSKPYLDQAVEEQREASALAIRLKDEEIQRLKMRLSLYESSDEYT